MKASSIIVPLAPSQQQVWLDQQANPDSPHLNIGGFNIINGPLDLDVFDKAVRLFVDNSDAMRLLPLNDGTQQLVDDWPGPLWTLHDLSDSQTPESDMSKWYEQTFAILYPFDDQQCPWQLALHKINDNKYAISLKAHHLVMDGYSTALSLQKMSEQYNFLINKTASPTTNIPSYSQFIDECSRYHQSKTKQKDAQYWHDVLPTLPPTLLEKRSANQQSDDLALAQHYSTHLTGEQHQAMLDLTKSHSATLYHLYIAALAIYFCRTHNTREMVLGIPVLNRTGKRYKSTMGMFAVVIPLRIELEKNDTTASLLSRVVQSLRSAYRHARYPLSSLMADLEMVHHGQDRLFDMMLSYEVQNFSTQFGNTPTADTHQLFSNTARYPLSVCVCQFNNVDPPIEIVYESSADYFTEQETQLLGKRMHQLTLQMVSSPDAAINTLPLLLNEERHDLIVAKHANVPSHPNPTPFISAFEQQAALKPTATALCWQSGKTNYKTLNEQANKLAHRLIKLGVGKDSIVAVVMPRQQETLTAFLAIAKAGGAFLPIDPSAPALRLQQLIKSSGAVVVLVGKSSVNVHHSQLVIEGDNAPQYDPALSTHNPDVVIDPNDLAYMLFTSGSTGAPKGVLMEHAPLARRLAWLARTFNYGPKDVWLQSIQLTFDPSIIEICLPLTQGASIALPPPGQLAPTDIAHHAQAFGATSIIFVPTTLRYFNQNANQYPNLKLRVAISGGEVLHRDMAMEFVNQTGAQLYNLYGPTEACIFATAYHFDDKKTVDPLPIGEPVDDTRIYILDANQQPLPIGTVGEIFIGGRGLARGYLNNQEITAERFIDDPFVAGERLYYSGDNGYWDHKGQVHFVGRIDNQIKLRGQRIEPGEIENALCELPQIEAAAVKKVDNELHGWLVLTSELDDTFCWTLCQEIAAELAHKLPEYMVPSSFTQITAMPRQTSGKLDYSSLEPNPPAANHQADNSDFASTDLQKLLLELFRQFLEQPGLGVKSDFFKNGGESLTALNLLSAIDKQIKQKLPLSILLHNPTVMTLSNAIVQRHHGLMVNLSNHKDGTPIYLAASGHGDALRFGPLADALGSTCNLRMLQPPIADGYTAYNSIEELAQYYAALIEQQHHQSPPIIAGFSVGGVAALETARQLTARSVPIESLILIDTTYPMRMFSRNALWRFCGWLIKSLGLQELSINQRTMGSLFSDPGLNGQIAALNKYHPAKLNVPTTLIISSGFSRWYRLLFKPWQRVFKKPLNEQHLEGFHGTLFAPEHVGELAKIIGLKDENNLTTEDAKSTEKGKKTA